MEEAKALEYDGLRVQHPKLSAVLSGLCRNDGEVFLEVEAFEEGDSPARPPKTVGEARWNIYPRASSPRANEHAPPLADMYHVSAVMTFLSEQNRQMQCGHLKYTAFFWQLLKLPQETADLSVTPRPKVAGSEEIVIIFHGAVHLPQLPDGQSPIPLHPHARRHSSRGDSLHNTPYALPDLGGDNQCQY